MATTCCASRRAHLPRGAHEYRPADPRLRPPGLRLALRASAYSAPCGPRPAYRIAVAKHPVVAAAPAVELALRSERHRVSAAAADGGDAATAQLLHALRPGGQLSIVPRAAAHAELAVVIAPPRPHLPRGVERQHMRASAGELRDRVAKQRRDEAWPGHRAALADAELAVVALAPREDAALPVEGQRRPRATHEGQHGRLRQRVDGRRHHARQEVAEPELTGGVRAPRQHDGALLSRRSGWRERQAGHQLRLL
eukprot:scaffold118078_cov63-Phaeocystis_antarctica.AAC.2